MTDQFQDVFADEIKRRYFMTKLKGDQLPLGFDDHYLIQGLRDQVERLQEALLSATEALNRLKEASAVVRGYRLPIGGHRKTMTIQDCAIVIGSDLRASDARSKEITRILDQLQQTEVKL